ncbi:hypothetical protein GZ77_05865 [Endozoicomonas montiporae]|uniref:Peptidase M23 n=2 Tax=Endozoicomonas montiporae TaxID=1027273 RepID=A0A081NC29_9GAMM|nr:peptidoglycan DD-metalloendopeptidase family protein [Endozoicomonas montiporae]AMO56324.1 metalloprotease, opacity-associated protein A family [Endozoicomonas montiporae CL-33]KEQ16002.1 hypothetical protein GZ77_05865 [Endozoicomonas montiporae]
MLNKITRPLRPFTAGLFLYCACTQAADTHYDLHNHQALGAPKQESLTDVDHHFPSEWQTYTVKDTDNIWTLFKHEGLSEFDLIDLFSVSGAGQYLGQLERSPTVFYQIDEQHRLQQFKLDRITGETILFERYQGKFLMTVSETAHNNNKSDQPQVFYHRVTGEISDSFYRSAKQSGLSTDIILQYSAIFQWDIDFNRDIQPGDRFSLLLESNDSHLQGTGTLVAAEFKQQNQSLTALLNDDGHYYTPTGQLIGGTFSRSPLRNNAPISSGFDLNRIHPITGIKRPHLGTDWATPIGTPVYAVASGVVKHAVKGHPAAGHYIELKNGGRYVTRYLHLDRLKVASGDTVKKGEVIGYSGNTGLSTGPHLHFELYIDGEAVDVTTAKLPDQKQLKGQSLQRFRRHSQNRLAQLQSGSGQSLLAANDTN